jgi:hypothetical protein
MPEGDHYFIQKIGEIPGKPYFIRYKAVPREPVDEKGWA